ELVRPPVRRLRSGRRRGVIPGEAAASSRAPTIVRPRTRGREVRQPTGVRRPARQQPARGRARGLRQPRARRRRGRADLVRHGAARSATPRAAARLLLGAGGVTALLRPPGRAALVRARPTDGAVRRVGRSGQGLRDAMIGARQLAGESSAESGVRCLSIHHCRTTSSPLSCHVKPGRSCARFRRRPQILSPATW
ncbi:MAG: hypothetical protein QOC73_976, partial [Actinomycetota bacterium]|nr:hypothetical protein [Actinomycetota bacterium]